MNNKIILIVIIIAAVLVGVYYTTRIPVLVEQKTTVSSPKDATYTIDGQPVTLTEGVSKVSSAPGSTSTITTTYFGNEVLHDLNGDGRDDTVFILTQNKGGSGTFYYVVAALNTLDGYVGSHGVLLGDRIAPQTTTMGTGNIVIVNYADRKPTDSFVVAPTNAKSMWLLLDPTTMQFGEVAQNFEGEADPARMTLTMKPWSWIKTLYSDDKLVTPRSEKKFTIVFTNNNTFSVTTDCNSVSGQYVATKNTISFTNMVSTLMYCDGTQEADFVKMLNQSQGYLFTSKGELVLTLKFDSGSIFFK